MAHILLYSDRIVVLGVGVGRAYKPVAACADALAQGAAIEDRIVDDRGNESRPASECQRVGGALPCGWQRY